MSDAAPAGRMPFHRFQGLLPVAVAVVLSGGLGYYIGSLPGGHEARPSPSTVPQTPTSTSPGSVSHAGFELGRGQAAAEFEFQAPDPKVYGFSVTADTHPAHAAIAFVVRVTGGASLNLGRTTDEQACQSDPAGTKCRFDLGLLEAEKPGTWVLRLEKESVDDATVNIRVSFERP